MNGVAEHGPGYELPDIKNEVQEYLKNVMKYAVKTGCSLIWKKPSFFNLQDNIFAYTPIGVACMDPSTLDQHNIFQFSEGKIFSVIESIGATNVVQLIIDNNDDLISSSDKCELGMYPWIYQSSCAACEIGSLLDKIYDVPWVYNTLKVAEWIVLYIYKNKVNVSLRRVQRKKHFMVVSHFFRLMSLLEVESELQGLQVSIVTFSSDWGKQLNNE